LFPHDAALLTLPVAVLLGGALVVQLLAGHQRQLALHSVALPVELERHAGVPLVLGAREDLGDLLAMQQQLAGPCRVGDLVGAGGVERHDMAAQQPRLAVLDQDIGIGQLGLAGAQALDLPAGQHQARLEGLVDVVLEARLLVQGDDVAAGALALAFLVGHETSYRVLARGGSPPHGGKRGTIQGLKMTTHDTPWAP